MHYVGYMSRRWNFGAAVASARKLDNMTQLELAEKLAEHNPTNAWTQYKVSRMENGRTPPTVEDLLDLAEVQRMEHAWYLVGPSIPAGRGIEANPGQLRSKPPKRRFRTSGGFRPALGL